MFCTDIKSEIKIDDNILICICILSDFKSDKKIINKNVVTMYVTDLNSGKIMN